jgi:hypothetical protein
MKRLSKAQVKQFDDALGEVVQKDVECALEEAECPPDQSGEYFAQDFCYEPEPCE